MKFLVVVATLVAYSTAAPSYGLGAAVGYGHTAVVPAGPPVTNVQESYHAGPAIARTHVEHGVVGHRTVQVGSQPVQVGHQYNVAGQEVHQPAPYSYVAGAPVSTQETRPIAPPALPVASPYNIAIPNPTQYHGPAPLNAVTQEQILAPVRVNQVITPKQTHIQPELHVNQVPYDVPVEVAVPVHRDVVVKKVVERPYNVAVPRAVPVAVPHPVNDYQEVVHTPIVREHTVSVHQPRVAVATQSYTHVAPAVVAQEAVAVHGYATAPQAVAVHGYATGPAAEAVAVHNY